MGKVYEYEEYAYRRPRHRSSSSPRRRGSRSRSRVVEEDDFVHEEMHLVHPISMNTEGMEVIRAPPPPPYRSQAVLPYPCDSDEEEYPHPPQQQQQQQRHYPYYEDRSGGPLDKSRSAADKASSNFTNSPAGISASLLGAVVGGYAARKVAARNNSGHGKKPQDKSGLRYSDVDQKKKKKENSSDNNNNNRVKTLSMIVGAVVGGLGANALTNKLEDKKARTKDVQRDWERRYGREENLPHFDDGRERNWDYGGDGGSGRAGQRYAKEDAEYDFVYDERNGYRPGANGHGYGY